VAEPTASPPPTEDAAAVAAHGVAAGDAAAGGAPPAAAEGAAARAGSLVGSRIGHLRFDALLGTGGMGEVYRGFDELLRRRLAIKVLRDDRRLSSSARGRFLREARLLSRLRHPNICQVHDYVVGDGIDLLVLELIEGRRLDAAMAEGMPTAARYEVAAQLLEALIAAHDQRVVHRDLKPANVMITPRGEVKVLDFGIARSVMALQGDDEASTGGEPTDSASASETQHGTVLGTLAFMSPEQTRGEPVTPASDMFACGLLLQELFTGRPARDTEQPRMGLIVEAAHGVSLPVRGLEPHLTELIDRMKAPAPGARPSARDAADRLRWLRERPRRRLRRALAGAGVALLAAVAGAMSYQAWRIGSEVERANQEAARAEREAQKARSEAVAARQVSDFLVALFKRSDPTAGRAEELTARQMLDRGAARMAKELGDQPATRARLLVTMGRAYRELALYPEADRLLSEAFALRERESPRDGEETAEAAHELGRLRDYQVRLEEARRLFQRALAIRERELPPEDPRLSETITSLAANDFRAARYAEAEALFGRALALARRRGDPVVLMRPLNNLANVHMRLGHYRKAAGLYEECRQVVERAYGPDHVLVGHPVDNLGMVLVLEGKLDAAEALFQRALAIWEGALGPDNVLVSYPINNLGNVRARQGRAEEARELYRRALAIRERGFGAEHPETAITIHDQAELERWQGRPALAVPLYRRALAIREKAYGASHPEVAQSLHGLGLALLAEGDAAGGRELLERALAIRRVALPPEHPDRVASEEAVAAARRRAPAPAPVGRVAPPG
jgi:tetratricopeptide (TPR) repeat protein